MKIRDRIKQFRRVPAGRLRPNPKNWRTHPESQRNALRGVLAEVGYADALLARELPDGSLELIDGHLRAELTPEMEVPMTIVNHVSPRWIHPVPSMSSLNWDAVAPSVNAWKK